MRFQRYKTSSIKPPATWTKWRCAPPPSRKTRPKRESCRPTPSPCFRSCLLRLVIVAQFQNLHFAETVVQVGVIEGAAHRFTTRRFIFVVAIFSKESGRLIDRHPLGVHFHRNAKPAKPQQCFRSLRHLVFGRPLLFLGSPRRFFGAAEPLVQRHLLAIM